MRNQIFLILISVIILVLAAATAWYLFHDLPDISQISSRLNVPSQRITDRNGRMLYNILSGEGVRHSPTDLSSISIYLQQAIVATEDASFYTNPGFDLIGILRAFWINLQSGGTRAGGSTITQQLSRNLLMTDEERSERTIRRKLRESLLAWLISQRLTKDQILAHYLNQTYFGDLTYGSEEAAHTYFGKSAAELDLAESALLAGIPQLPAVYNPLINPEKALERQKVVLGLMEDNGFITTEQRTLAEREPLIFSTAPYPMEAPHFVLMIREQIDALADRCEFSEHTSMIIRTTIDLDWQHLAEKAIRKQLENLRKPIKGAVPGQGSIDHNVSNAALVAIDPRTGEIYALVGSADYSNIAISGSVNMATAPRQPGSALKPFIYAAAFDANLLPPDIQPWTAASMILDVKTTFMTHDGNPYTPANYDNQEHGPVLARQALASSLNIPAVKALQYISLDTLFRLATGLGINTFHSPEEYDLSLALGGGEVTLLELSAAYAVLANDGYYLKPVSILDIRTEDGALLYSNSAQAQDACVPDKQQIRVVDERVAWLISDILSDDNARTLGFGKNSILQIDRPAAVKTGTTSNFHDNWTIGYTPDLAVGVWVGNTDHQPMRQVSGLTGAGFIWHEFTRSALSGRPELPFIRPPGLEKVKVCTLSGLLPSPACPYTHDEWFLDGTQPSQEDKFYKQVIIDEASGTLAQSDTSAQNRRTISVLDLPPDAVPWARSQGLTLLGDLQAISQSDLPIEQGVALTILSPQQNAVFRILPGYTTTQRLIIQAHTNLHPLNSLTIFVDGIALATLTEPPYQTWWNLQTGLHTVWAEMNDLAGQTFTSERIVFNVIP